LSRQKIKTCLTTERTRIISLYTYIHTPLHPQWPPSNILNTHPAASIDCEVNMTIRDLRPRFERYSSCITVWFLLMTNHCELSVYEG